MHVSWKIAVYAGLLAFAMASTAGADTLESRLGGLAVYDTGTGLTWTANANLAAGSAFDDGPSNTDGHMTRANALAWAAALDLGGHKNWRLPTTPLQDPGLSIQDFDAGGVLVDLGSGGVNVLLSEMGHMYWHLTGVAGSIIHTQHPLISNVQVFGPTPFYWTGTQFGNITSGNFTFGFANSVSAHARTFDLAAWAVTDGDVFGTPGAPEPATLALLGLGLIAVGRARRKRRGT